MSQETSVVLDSSRLATSSHPKPVAKSPSQIPQFLSTAEAARMLGLSTTLVQTLVDQGDLKGWKTRGGHRRISLDSILGYQTDARQAPGSPLKASVQPHVTIVIESSALFSELKAECASWNLSIDVRFFDSVTEALLELSSQKPDMMVVEMSMPRAQQEKTFQALENFNQRGPTPLSVVLITSEKSLKANMPAGASSAIQVVSGPLSAVWLHAYLTGVIASYRV
jgi:excisionase family DNA binding protein